MGRKGVALTRTFSYLRTWLLTYLVAAQRWDMLGALIYKKTAAVRFTISIRTTQSQCTQVDFELAAAIGRSARHQWQSMQP